MNETERLAAWARRLGELEIIVDSLQERVKHLEATARDTVRVRMLTPEELAAWARRLGASSETWTPVPPFD